MDMIKAALFPIPNCACFPGTIMPLHVFEPRYRSLVNYCLEHNSLLGVCHTEELIKPNKPNQTYKEALNTNQATYKPFSIFTAGKVALKETLVDGRMLIDVHLTTRLKATQVEQSLPFSIYSCELYNDLAISDESLHQTQLLQRKLMTRLLVLTRGQTDIYELLSSEEWQQMDAVDFSFRLFGLIRSEGDIQQQILQCRSPVERLNIALQLLNRI